MRIRAAGDRSYLFSQEAADRVLKDGCTKGGGGGQSLALKQIGRILSAQYTTEVVT